MGIQGRGEVPQCRRFAHARLAGQQAHARGAQQPLEAFRELDQGPVVSEIISRLAQGGIAQTEVLENHQASSP